jgi:hypothetical protein
MTYTENRIAAFKNFQFPQILKNLKKYLEMIKWLRQHIPWFAQRSEILQNRKTALLRQDFPQSLARKNYTIKTLIGNLIELEIKSFNLIQEIWNGNIFLYHFDPNLRIYIDIDASKK